MLHIASNHVQLRLLLKCILLLFNLTIYSNGSTAIKSSLILQRKISFPAIAGIPAQREKYSGENSQVTVVNEQATCSSPQTLLTGEVFSW